MKLGKSLPAIAALTFLLGMPSAGGAADEGPIRIGFNGEPGNQIVVQTATRILENRLDYKVKVVQASNALQWQGIAQGSMDAMLVAWLPTTQAAYWEKFKDEVVDLGVMFTGKIGWVIPAYIPKDQLNSIKDLKKPDVRQKLDSTIVGIQPGAGIMDRSQKSLKAYGLEEYRLRNSSTAAMTAALKRAASGEDWVVVTGWSPLHIFARWDLRYLKDPKGVFGVTQKIHAMAREGIREDAPRAAAFLAQYALPRSVLEQALLRYNRTENIEKTVSKLIESNPDLVDEWIAGLEEKLRYAQ